MKNTFDYPVPIPADAAGANCPGPRAPKKAGKKSPSVGADFTRPESGGLPGQGRAAPTRPLEVHEAWNHEGKPGDKRYDQHPDQQYDQVRHIGTRSVPHVDLTYRAGDKETDPEGGLK